MRYFSIIIPVYNRPDEIDELLDSFTRQEDRNFEIIVVEDGSTIGCDHIVEKYKERLDIRYFFKPNSGPGTARNYGAQRSRGNYLIFLDSDCTVPDNYLKEVGMELYREDVDTFGGPDRANDSFSTTQKAIDYSMTSFLTTGGIRGRKRSIARFYPRSFNMGIKRSVFERLGGFSDMRFGEDIDLSYRVAAGGYTARLSKTTSMKRKLRNVLSNLVYLFLFLMCLPGIIYDRIKRKTGPRQ